MISRKPPRWLFFLGIGLLWGCGVPPTPPGLSPDGVATWVIGTTLGRSQLRSLDEVLEPGEPPAGIEPQRFIVWGEPPAGDSPFVRDKVVHAVWMQVQGRLYAADEETYRRYRSRCGDGNLTCVLFALLEFSHDRAIVQIDTFVAPLAGRGERITLRWEKDAWKAVNIVRVWIS